MGLLGTERDVCNVCTASGVDPEEGTGNLDVHFSNTGNIKNMNLHREFTSKTGTFLKF